jgi:hypothetical protein
VNAYKDGTAIRSSGIHIAGTKYFTLKADDRSIYGKQVFSFGKYYVIDIVKKNAMF